MGGAYGFTTPTYAPPSRVRPLRTRHAVCPVRRLRRVIVHRFGAEQSLANIAVRVTSVRSPVRLHSRRPLAGSSTETVTGPSGSPL